MNATRQPSKRHAKLFSVIHFDSTADVPPKGAGIRGSRVSVVYLTANSLLEPLALPL